MAHFEGEDWESTRCQSQTAKPKYQPAKEQCGAVVRIS